MRALFALAVLMTSCATITSEYLQKCEEGGASRDARGEACASVADEYERQGFEKESVEYYRVACTYAYSWCFHYAQRLGIHHREVAQKACLGDAACEARLKPEQDVVAAEEEAAEKRAAERKAIDDERHRRAAEYQEKVTRIAQRFGAEFQAAKEPALPASAVYEDHARYARHVQTNCALARKALAQMNAAIAAVPRLEPKQDAWSPSLPFDVAAECNEQPYLDLPAFVWLAKKQCESGVLASCALYRLHRQFGWDVRVLKADQPQQARHETESLQTKLAGCQNKRNGEIEACFNQAEHAARDQDSFTQRVKLSWTEVVLTVVRTGSPEEHSTKIVEHSNMDPRTGQFFNTYETVPVVTGGYRTFVQSPTRDELIKSAKAQCLLDIEQEAVR
jgi:hypothetical protein